jgi:hypothetical protein
VLLGVLITSKNTYKYDVIVSNGSLKTDEIKQEAFKPHVPIFIAFLLNYSSVIAFRVMPMRIENKTKKIIVRIVKSFLL